jgi:hypothetical protein
MLYVPLPQEEKELNAELKKAGLSIENIIDLLDRYDVLDKLIETNAPPGTKNVYKFVKK